MYNRPRANVLFIGSISAALSVLHEGEERGLISRTPAGNRAYILKQQRF